MSDTAKKLFESLKAIAPGMNNFLPEVSGELRRLNTQGAMELASALFHGSAFVPYGPGQYTPSPERAEPVQENHHEHMKELER
ncbi:MAG: hypothetical protein HZA51_13425 [Planctomycetes bacterium]|nr:hypothetical protein [Planctomycetota bacterium]